MGTAATAHPDVQPLSECIPMRAGVAFVPYALYVLCAAPLGRALGTAAAALALTAGPLLVTDRLFYGTWTVRDWAWAEHEDVVGELADVGHLVLL